MDMNRREFIAATVAGAGGMLLAGQLGAAETVNPFEIVQLGKTGIKVSRIGMGTGMNGGHRESNHTRMGQEKFTAIVRHAYDMGVRLFDAADMYGTHRYLARALKGIPRESYALTSKIWRYPGDTLPETERPDANICIDRFRKELNTDYIDVVLLHCMMTAKWPDEQKRQMDIMADLKAKGIIRACGVSIHSLDALKTTAQTPWVDSVHVRINHTGQQMDAPPEQVVPVVKKIHDAGKGTIAMKVLAQGEFKTAEERAASVKFLMSLGTIDTCVIGFEKPEQVDEFAKNMTLSLQAARNA